MGVIGWLIFADVFATLWFLPVFILWCVIPGKSVREGFTDWFNED